ncbi:MAG: copper chaperone PCu(A)C [Brevundimonas sp.]|nr:MAG: copper chaperone PCu(A)C [Brevundimonas sp.]
MASPAAASVQIHSGMSSDGQMSMAPVEAGLSLPLNQPVTLAPGQNHIMLMNLTRPLVAGDVVSLTLDFNALRQRQCRPKCACRRSNRGPKRRAKNNFRSPLDGYTPCPSALDHSSRPAEG